MQWQGQTYLSVREVAERFQRSRAQVYSWIKVGVRGVRLATIRVGSLRISEAALQQFFEMSAAPADTNPPAGAVPAPTKE